MIDTTQFESIAQRLSALLPDDLGAAKEEFGRNVKAVHSTRPTLIS
jgi:BMFP domain-containing protein YqiC